MTKFTLNTHAQLKGAWEQPFLPRICTSLAQHDEMKQISRKKMNEPPVQILNIIGRNAGPPVLLNMKDTNSATGIAARG